MKRRLKGEKMSASGIVFDIKELAVFDGPGIRTIVFLKGCPLRCQWCHNPEGLHISPQLMVSGNSCTDCGRCKAVCEHPDNCILCGKCIRACPLHLRRICGEEYTADRLAALLRKDAEYLEKQGGGVTFSGGEPTMQTEFLIEVLEKLNGVHRCMETCGQCDSERFQKIIDRLEFIIMDIKFADGSKHKKYTGADNSNILANLELLKASGKPFIIRIPLIPGVNNDAAELTAIAALLKDAANLQRVELLPYHKTAGAKYSMVGLNYAPDFDVNAEPDAKPEIFRNLGIDCTVL